MPKMFPDQDLGFVCAAFKIIVFYVCIIFIYFVVVIIISRLIYIILLRLLVQYWL